MKRLFAMSLLWLALAAAGAVPEHSEVLPDIDEESMRARLDELPLQPLEGIWFYPAEHMTLGIERTASAPDETYRVVLLASDDVELLPGTIVGHIVASATPDKYSLWLYSERDRLTLCRPMECVATLNRSATSLTFDPPHWDVKVRVNFARFLPSIFGGISIIPHMEKEKLPIGFKKIYPEGGNGNEFNEIRYL